MLDRQDLMLLTRWCRARSVAWQPARSEDNEPALLLQGRIAAPAWTGMLLAVSDDGFTLTDAGGETLATTSDLAALLDALDAGLAARPAAPHPVATTYARPGSATLWNSAWSAIT